MAPDPLRGSEMADNPAARSQSPMVFLILLGLGAVGLILRPSSTSTPPHPSVVAKMAEAKEDEARKAKETPLVSDPLSPLKQFRAIRPKGGATSPFDDAPELLDERLEFLIVTVPDPIDSRFGYRFDSLVDAVQMAVEAQDDLLDRFWLPWMPGGQQPKAHDPIGPTFDRPDDPLPLHAREPGVMLFRPASGPSGGPLKVVFLVGETPLSGLHKVAFARALDIIDTYERANSWRLAPAFFPLRRPAGSGAPEGLDREGLRGLPPRPVRIVGPFFSGTAPSMALTIAAWETRTRRVLGPLVTALGAPRRRYVVRTGSAMSVNVDRFVADAQAGAPTTGEGRWSVEFSATVLPEDLVFAEMFDHLKVLNGGGTLGKVALLHESDTPFGAFGASELGRKLLKEYNILRMEFPFHISQVRIAYDQNQPVGTPGLPTLARTSSKLKVPFDETGRPRDIVPALSPAMTATTDEYVLARILATISREEYRYVGILATDTRDVIFLAGLIREFCPDVQLFSFQGDLLLAHPDYTSQLRGMLVASPYPLFSMAQRWTFPFHADRRRHLFSYQGQQGYYHAALTQLLDEKGPTIRREDSLEFLDYGFPFRRERNPWITRPPLWISVVGERGLWPIECRDPTEHLSATQGVGRKGCFYRSYVHGVLVPPTEGLEVARSASVPKAKGDDDEDADGRWEHLAAPRFTWVWGTAHILNSALLLLATWAACFGIAGAGPSAGWMVALLRPRDGGLRHQQEFCVLCGLGGAIFLYVFLASPCFVTPWGSDWGTWNGAFGICARLLALGTFAATLTLLFIKRAIHDYLGDDRAWKHLVQPRLSRVFALFAAVAMVAFLIGWAAVLWGDPWLARPTGYRPHEVHRMALDRMVFERTVNATNGVSPLTPALFLGAFAGLWMLYHLHRLYIVDRLKPEGSNFGADLDRLMFPWFPIGLTRPAFLLAAVVFALGVFKLFDRFVAPVDGLNFGRIMFTAFAFCSAAIATALVRFVRLWRGLKVLLQQAGQLPFQRAFDRLPSVVTRTYGRYLDRARPRRSTIELPVKQWQATARALCEALRTDGGLTLRTADFRLNLDPADPLVKALKAAMAHPEAPPGLEGDREPYWRAAVKKIQQKFKEAADAQKDRWGMARGPFREELLAASRACWDVLEYSSRGMPLVAAYGDLSTAPVATPPLPLAPSVPAGVTSIAGAEAGHVVVGVTIESSAPTKPSPAPAPAADSGEGGAAWRWYRSAEELVALELIARISPYSIHLKNLATFLTFGPLLLLLTVTSYPFQPQRFLMLFIWTIVLGVVSTLVYVYVQMDRDEFLSRVSKTPPDKITFDQSFFAKIIAYVIPLAGLVIAQFPDLSDLLNSWLEPLTRVLR